MKKKTFIYLALSLICIIGYCKVVLFPYLKEQILIDRYRAWELNWGFNVPKAASELTVFENEGRDGEAYIICNYNQQGIQKIRELRLWSKVDSKSYKILSKRIEKYKHTIKELHFQEENRYRSLFANNPIELDEDSLWFVRDHEDGSSFVAILDTNKRKLYTLEIFF